MSGVRKAVLALVGMTALAAVTVTVSAAAPQQGNVVDRLGVRRQRSDGPVRRARARDGP